MKNRRNEQRLCDLLRRLSLLSCQYEQIIPRKIQRKINIAYADGVHNRTVLSLEADANKSPSGENWTSVTTP